MKGIWAALVALELTTTGCALNPRPVEPAGVERSASVILHGKALDLHLSAPLGGPTVDALVLYASGDGGWFGAAVDMFHRIGGAGYYTVGFSAKAFLKIDRRPDTPMNPEQLAAEYVQILDTARRDLHLQPGTEVVLTGWSRGAAFAVLAASAQGAPRGLRGVLAIGLSEGEDLEINGPADESDDGVATEAHDHWPFEPYALMALLPFRCAVIQATQDNFLVAARARTLFGSDTGKRRLYAVDARNHRFSGGKDAFDRALIDALGWITSSASSSSGADLVDASEAAWPLRRSHPSASNQEK
jgi:fermentation-respiration switch protein FrsA (DUF1100 family)